MNKSYPEVFDDFIQKLTELMAEIGVCSICDHAYPDSEMTRDGHQKICGDCNNKQD